jgi:hypothetical protein
MKPENIEDSAGIRAIPQTRPGALPAPCGGPPIIRRPLGQNFLNRLSAKKNLQKILFCLFARRSSAM